MVKSELDLKPQPLYGHLPKIDISSSHLSHLVTTGHIWLSLVTSYNKWSHLVTPGHIISQTRSHLVTYVKSGPTWSQLSHLFTPGHTCHIWSH